MRFVVLIPLFRCESLLLIPREGRAGEQYGPLLHGAELMEVATEENPEFKAKWEILENSMRFHDIAVEERVFKQKVEPFTEREQQQVYDRVKVCREWLWKFHEQHRRVQYHAEKIINAIDEAENIHTGEMKGTSFDDFMEKL